ncbi:MAG: energy coupling factor transporter S component ThiW [Catonella sp.]|nr:energy coupling factor transporter S component ThiW [Catonella sp.]MDY6357375.1 energy coupling factor transporter S component ThiW [Catonella sp.]
MKKINVKKLAVAGMFTALAVILSAFSIPIGASKCFPVQHMVNVLSAVILGPFYGLGIAFCTSLIRNLLGTGTLLAFPGSMVGALLAGIAYDKLKKIIPTCIAEVLGTGILGGMLSYPIASFIMGREAALFTYVIPFLVSTVGGSIFAAILIFVFKKTGALYYMQHALNENELMKKAKA